MWYFSLATKAQAYDMLMGLWPSLRLLTWGGRVRRLLLRVRVYDYVAFRVFVRVVLVLRFDYSMATRCCLKLDYIRRHESHM